MTVVLGAVCETNVDECASNPCLNSGTCYDLVNGYSCSCTPEYVGRTCSELYCRTNNPCRNGGTCYSAGWCLCPPHFVGADCSVDRCDLLDCKNGGSCIDGSCVCPPGIIGANCDLVQCSLVICMVPFDSSIAHIFNLFGGLILITYYRRSTSLLSKLLCRLSILLLAVIFTHSSCLLDVCIFHSTR